MLTYLQMLDSEADEIKFTQLYTKYKELMFRTAKRLVPDDSDAEDVVHEAFLALMRHFHKISEVDCLKTRAYIVIIVERKAIDHLRKHKHETESYDERIAAKGLYIPEPGDHELADALAGMGAECRQIMLWRYDYGYSVREIANMLGKSYAAVDKMLWRGKKELEKKLKEKGYVK